MEKTLIATNVIDRPRQISGVYQAAWRVTIGDITGTAVHTFEWDGRDIENETLMASPEIAEALKEEISECGFPDPGSCGFCDTGEREDGKHDAMDAALDQATVIVYDAD